jgi:hypothetical protein
MPTTARVARVHEYGPPEVLRFEDIVVGEPGLKSESRDEPPTLAGAGAVFGKPGADGPAADLGDGAEVFIGGAGGDEVSLL